MNRYKPQLLSNLQDKITNNPNLLVDFNTDIILQYIHTNSCYDFKKTKLNTYSNIIPKIDNTDKDIPEYKSLIVNMYVNNTQHILLQQWFNAYILMYNSVITYYNKIKVINYIKNIKFIKDEIKLLDNELKQIKLITKNLLRNKSKLQTQFKNITKKSKNSINKQKINEIISEIKNIKLEIKNFNSQFHHNNCKLLQNNKILKKLNTELKIKLSYENVRTYHLKNKRNFIQLHSTENFKDRIRTHVLDTAIKTACANYKTCSDNYINNRIKRFRIKYWKFNKNNKILEIEKESIKNGKFFDDVFGSFKFKYNNKNYQLTSDSTVKIQYVSYTNQYYLLVSKKIEKTETKSEKYIAIDQNVNPFIACRTNDELISIGSNTSKIIERYLLKIDKVKKVNNLTKKQKKNKEKFYYRKIKNKVSETHWKIINYLIKNYKYIIIGNLSMKKASKREKSKVSGITKRVGLMMCISEFRKRLEYKCLVNGIKINIVNEGYTSKVCSQCGNCKKKLEGEKIYECLTCNVKRDRDFNSATNMIYLSI